MKRNGGWFERGALFAFAVVLLALVVVQSIFAAALSEDRNTPQRDGKMVSLNVASGSVIYAGSMVAVNASGLAVPASDTAGLSVIGRAEEFVDASVTAGLPVTVARGAFRWENGNSITDASIGGLAYALDDQTVKTAAVTNWIIAGVIVDVDADGVWVDTYNIGSQGAASISTLAASGNATVGGTLGVTGAATLSGGATVPALIVLGTKTGTLDVATTGSGTNSLVFIVGTTTNIVKENI